MGENKSLGPAEIIPPLVAVAGTIVWITVDGFTGESIAQALTTLCTMFVILIPIYRHILKKPKDTHLEAGMAACRKIQSAHPLILCGPKYRKDDYAPDSSHPDHQYLFVQKPDSRKKAVLVSVSPFKKAIVEINFSHTLMDLLNIKGDFLQQKSNLHDALVSHATGRYAHLFAEKKMEKYENVCVVLDFDIEKVSVRAFKNIVHDLLDVTIRQLRGMREPS